MASQKRDFSPLYRVLAYQFHNESILRQAMSHRSYSTENNERMEFMGDAIVDVCVAEMLYETFPQAPEGTLSRYRSSLVKKEALAEVARSLSLRDHLFLGEGELKNGGFDRDSILADAFEALCAAIYFDSNWDTVKEVVRRLFFPRIGKMSEQDQKDSKSLLQEWLQARHLGLPNYHLQSHQELSQGSHSFTVRCTLNEKPHETLGTGTSRRFAEQDAAQTMLNILKTEEATSQG